MSNKYTVKFRGRRLGVGVTPKRTFSVIVYGVSEQNAIDNLYDTYGMEFHVEAVLSVKALIA